MSVKTKKRVKKKRKTKKEIQVPLNITKNGERIFKAMRGNKVKGNWKDWVLFVSDQMIDRYGTYTIQRDDGAGPSEIIALVHKSKLKALLGDKFGARFWDHKWKRRINHGAPPVKAKTAKEGTDVQDES